MRIVLGLPNLIDYQQGGGHWTWAFQYPLALRDVGCEVLCLTAAQTKGDRSIDESRAFGFISRIQEHCPGVSCCVILRPKGEQPGLSEDDYYGLRRREFENWAKNSDVLWNLGGRIRKPLLDFFPRKVLVDGDPGHFQVSGLQCDVGITDHQKFLTVGLNLGKNSCQVPLHDRTWTTFPQMLFLDWWKFLPDPGPAAPFTSLTHWTWEELSWNNRRLSCSKREAYLELVNLPRLSGRCMTLAANLDDPKDKIGDKRLFESHGWTMVDPWALARTPADYQSFIANSRAEICAPKPIYVDLRTGWLSDRSAGYLATGRPVLMRDTGISENLPTGLGLATFTTLDEAADKAREIDANYAKHSKCARMLAEDLLNSRKVVPRMLDACR